MSKASRKKKLKRENSGETLPGFPPEDVYSAPFRSFTLKTYLHLLLIAVIGVMAYSNTFHVPFVLDDVAQIQNNQMVKDVHNFLLALKGHDFASGAYKYTPSRFIGYLSFALNYHFSGPSVTGYHVTNLLIHLTNAVLVYFFVQLTFKTPYLNGPEAPLFTIHDSRSSGLIALFSALLFVSHPLQTQAVTYVVQRFASLATLFYLLSLVMYIKGRQILVGATVRVEKDPSSNLRPYYSVSALACFILSFVSAVLAMKTKEIAFTLPFVIILYEFIFFTAPLKKKLVFLLPVLLTLIIVPLSVMHSDKPIGEMLSDISEKTRIQTQLPRWDYLMTEMRVITTYVRLIFLPVNQNLDYDYPVSRSFFGLPVLLSFLFLASLLGAAVYLIYRTQRAKREAQSVESSMPYALSATRLVAFGIIWFFVTLSVESSFIPIVDVIFEHRVYLPSIGIFISITAGMFIVARRLRKETSIVWTLVLVTLAFSAVTYARNNVWKDGVSLWEDTVKKSPNKARPHNNLGEAYYKFKLFDKAEGEFQAALKIRPDYGIAHNNLGAVYGQTGRLEDAMREYQAATDLIPDSVVARINLGTTYAQLGRLEEAKETFQTAVRTNPGNAIVHNNLGAIYGRMGRTEAAIREYQTAMKLDPDYTIARDNLEGLIKRMKSK